MTIVRLRNRLDEVAPGLVLGFVLFLVAALFAGCAHSDKTVLGFEKGLAAGSLLVDAAVDSAIESCEKENLPTPEQRAECVEDAAQLVELTEKATKLAVDGMRLYWAGRASDNAEMMVQGLALIKDAAVMLPPEHFKGLKK